MTVRNVELHEMPGILPAMLDGLLRPRRPFLADGSVLPRTVMSLEGARIDTEQVRAYRLACGFGEGTSVPVTYPLVFAFPLQLALLTQPEWPLRPAGLIHLGVTLCQSRALDPSMTLRVACSVGDESQTARGIEFGLRVTIEDQSGEPVWEGLSKVLSRARQRGKAGRLQAAAKASEGEAAPLSLVGEFEVPPDTGRHYARVSKDWNPIHLGWLGARAFGFPRPVAHGMWTLARTLALMEEGGGSTGVEAHFRAPLLLPGKVIVKASAPASAARGFEVRDAGQDRLLLAGCVHRHIEAEKTLT